MTQSAWRDKILIIFFLSFFFVSCIDPFSPFDHQTNLNLPNGYGAINLQLSNNSSRTILPDVPALNSFAVFEFIFTATVNGEDRTVSFTTSSIPAIVLIAGTYDITVNAYRSGTVTSPAELGARGSATGIVINPGANITQPIQLQALLTSGTGTFNWSVNITATNVTSAEMTIMQGSTFFGGSPVTLNTSGTSSGNISLTSGVYNVSFRLIKDGSLPGSTKEALIWNEVLYIYSSLTSNYSRTFDNDFFHRTHYNVTLDHGYDIAGVQVTGLQSVLHGDTLTRPTPDPTRSGWNFINWYSDDTFNNVYNFSTVVMNDFTIYADWEIAIFEIWDEDDLRAVGRGNMHKGAVWSLDDDYILMANINLTQGNWTPIGGNTLATAFTGEFDGNGKIITGLIINNTTITHQGMFGFVNDGIIKNLGLEGVSISGANNTGGIAGQLDGNTRIFNCFVTGTVNGNANTGGIAGNVVNAQIKNCYVTANVTGAGATGGIAGLLNNANALINNCYVTGRVQGANNVGGILGQRTLGSVTNSIALNESIIGTGTAVGRVAGVAAAANLVNNRGWTIMPVTVSTSSAKATASAANNIDGLSATSSVLKTQAVWQNAAAGAAFLFGNDEDNPWVWDGRLPRFWFENTGRNFPGFLNPVPLTIDTPAAFNNASQIEHFTFTVSGVSMSGVNSIQNTNIMLTNATFVGNPVFAGGVLTFTIQPTAVGLILVTLNLPHDDFIYIDGSRIINAPTFADGTAGNPIFVHQANVLRFRTLADSAAGRTLHYRVIENITLTANWTRIGNSAANAFNGTLNGNGFTISGLTVSGNTDDNGMFGFIGTNGVVRNIGLTNVDIRGRNRAAAIAGTNNGLIEHCFVTGSLIIAEHLAAGITGSNNGIVRNCYVNVTRIENTTSWATISGIAGSNTNGSVINCVSLVQTFEDWYDGGVFAIASGGTLTNNWRRNGLLGTSNNPNDNNGGLITTANAGTLWNTLGFTAANSPLWANPANLPNLSNFANP